jgi:hypothetical protein
MGDISEMYKVVQIWPGLIVCKQVTVCPGHIWTTLYIALEMEKIVILHASCLSKWQTAEKCQHHHIKRPHPRQRSISQIYSSFQETRVPQENQERSPKNWNWWWKQCGYIAKITASAQLLLRKTALAIVLPKSCEHQIWQSHKLHPCQIHCTTDCEVPFC